MALRGTLSGRPKEGADVRSAVLLSLTLAVAALFVFTVPAPVSAQVSVGISVGYAPPPLPQYNQPYATQPNMIWQPGYWGFGPYGYFWVPGTWVQAPQVGLLWTPGYWGWTNGQYGWYAGYWGQNVGYYGGINYGYGYYGSGYRGGRWNGNSFQYNRSVTNVGGSIGSSNYYSDPGSYVNQNNLARTSYNGGAHGVTARPSQAQIATEHQRTYPMTSAQTAHVAVAQQNRSYLDSVNHGSPSQASVSKPLAANNHPAGFTAVKPQQPAAAAKPVQHPAAAPQQHAAAPQQHAAAPQQHAVAAKPPQQQHAAPAAKPHASPAPVDADYWTKP
jgi:hypothetical protein